jgi:hypothetical protein
MERLTKKQLSLYHTRCVNLIRRKPPEFMVFKKLGIYGWCRYEDDVLLVDHRKSPIRTAYHECLHYLYPEWSETRVLRVESRMINKLTMLEIAQFMKYVSIKLYKSELTKKIFKTRKANKKKKLKKKNKSVVKRVTR